MVQVNMWRKMWFEDEICSKMNIKHGASKNEVGDRSDHYEGGRRQLCVNNTCSKTFKDANDTCSKMFKNAIDTCSKMDSEQRPRARRRRVGAFSLQVRQNLLPHSSSVIWSFKDRAFHCGEKPNLWTLCSVLKLWLSSCFVISTSTPLWLVPTLNLARRQL